MNCRERKTNLKRNSYSKKFNQTIPLTKCEIHLNKWGIDKMKEKELLRKLGEETLYSAKGHFKSCDLRRQLNHIHHLGLCSFKCSWNYRHSSSCRQMVFRNWFIRHYRIIDLERRRRQELPSQTQRSSRKIFGITKEIEAVIFK